MGGCVQCIMHSTCQGETVCFLDLGQVLRVEVTFCVTVGATKIVRVTFCVTRLQNRCQVEIAHQCHVRSR